MTEYIGNAFLAIMFAGRLFYMTSRIFIALTSTIY